MFGKKSSKITILDKMLGTQEDYQKTVRTSNFTSEEKDIMMLASAQLKKKNYSSEVLDKAYKILFQN